MKVCFKNLSLRLKISSSSLFMYSENNEFFFYYENIEFNNLELYLINIMNECWNHEINKRPTINQILDSMEENLNKIE